MLYYGGGGIESCGGQLSLNEMLLQSHEWAADRPAQAEDSSRVATAPVRPPPAYLIRLFPCWPRALDARFGALRACGAFLVSAELKDGAVGGVRLVSEKGCACALQNPWPGRTVRLGRNGRPAEALTGERFVFTTSAGERLTLEPEGGR